MGITLLRETLRYDLLIDGNGVLEVLDLLLQVLLLIIDVNIASFLNLLDLLSVLGEQQIRLLEVELVLDGSIETVSRRSRNRSL